MRSTVPGEPLSRNWGGTCRVHRREATYRAAEKHSVSPVAGRSALQRRFTFLGISRCGIGKAASTFRQGFANRRAHRAAIVSGNHALRIKISVELELPRLLERSDGEDRRVRPAEMPGSYGTTVETIHELIRRYPKPAYELGLFFRCPMFSPFLDQSHPEILTSVDGEQNLLGR